MGARLTFAVDALTAMGAPVTQTNILFVLGQLDRDSGQQGQTQDQTGWNPGNISHDVPGVPAAFVSRYNTRAYSTYQQGVAAYAAQYHEQFMAGTLAAMKSNASLQQISQAFIASGYATAGYNVADFVGNKTISQLDGNLRDVNGNVVTNVQPLNPAQLTSIIGTLGNALGPITGLGNTTGGAADSLAGLVDVGKFFAALMDPNTWKRILLVLGGAAACAIAFLLIKDDTFGQVAGDVEKYGGDIAKVAAIAA